MRNQRTLLLTTAVGISMAAAVSLIVIGCVRAAPATTPTTTTAGAPQNIWVEAETMGPLKGANFSFQPEAVETKGSWSMSGPGVAAEFTQGGESEFMSIASRADEAAGVSAGRDIEVPVAGPYTLWVRYADYRGKNEEFGVRVRQNGKVAGEHVFGTKPIADEMETLMLFWNWSFAWDSAAVSLEKGPARLELYTTGPTQARRQIDCLCLTTDTNYHPTGRRKPDFAAWRPLRAMQQAGMPDVAPLATMTPGNTLPAAWKLEAAPPAFLWNVKDPWLQGLKGAPGERVDAPYWVDSALQTDFLAAFKGQDPPVYSHKLSGPAIGVADYPKAFANGSPVMEWLTRHPDKKFSILWNYGVPTWPANTTAADKAVVYANLKKFEDRFVGFVSGEAISYANYDTVALNAKVSAAKTRGEVLAALRQIHSDAVQKAFSDYYGTPLTVPAAWAQDIPCLSASNEAFAHALCNWGVKHLGHEGSGNSPTLARRLAFLRGAARQFGVHFMDYQSCNLGDASSSMDRSDLFYPGSSRYILDNQYDAWSGAGMNWLWKDYTLFEMAGAEAIYHEEGMDVFWKPGGGAAGDTFPVQLSPKGRVDEAAQKTVESHPRGTQYTPVAFLLDEAHGWAQERFNAGSFGLEASLNPALLTPGRHEAAIRGWFDVAYYPAPETQNEPSSGVRQTFVNGIFGDIFDVIVTASGHTAIASTYPVIIASGEVSLSTEWGRALHDYVQRGGTLVASADQFTGPGVAELGLPAFGAVHEAADFTWSAGGERVASNVFRYRELTVGQDKILAKLPDGSPLCVAHPIGKGSIIAIGAPLGLGINERPIPLLGLLMHHLTQGLVPVKVSGQIEWLANRLDDGGWLVTLLNNRGVIKPQHGVVPTDETEAQTVRMRVPFGVARSNEWMTNTPVQWQADGGAATVTVTVPAGAVRQVSLYP